MPDFVHITDALLLDRFEILADARLIPPSLLNIPAVLRYYAGREEPADEQLRRYLANPPDPVVGGNDVGVPQRFLELEDSRARDPRSLPGVLDEWLKEAHAKAVFDPSPAKVIEYCSALDLAATEWASKGQHSDAALLVAQALDLCPRQWLFGSFLLEHSGTLAHCPERL